MTEDEQDKAIRGLLNAIDELIAGQKEIISAHNQAIRNLESRIEALEATGIIIGPQGIIHD